MLGLGTRAGNVVIGVDGVRGALQRDELWCLVLAQDASPRAIEKVVALAGGKKVPVITGPTADELGVRLGRPPVMVVGVSDKALADGILKVAGKSGERLPMADS